MYAILCLLLIQLLLLHPNVLLAQDRSYVDEAGVLRWRGDNSEIHGFGINYSTPFAHAYRMAERLGVAHEDAIRQDVYHFARLDLDLYRIHVWDTEISDTLGNLLQNEHLHLFDFAIHEMKQRGMKFVITPIAFWGGGWPEPDLPTPGFSHKYGKAACLTHPEAIMAQESYLYQFFNHVNQYTGMAYKDDPDIIAFEVSNEPHHGGTVEEVTAFINRMVGAMRNTGTQTPILYNMSHSIHLHEAYMNADVQGGTFQWYPTGLVARRQINGNFLPHVSKYHIPFADHSGFDRMAKIVYEFDAADVEGNYMYPAMARSFREAGMQLACHFDYDAMFLAPYNTNYGTHYMSLPYAPQKAISLKIASAVFHEIPRYADFGGFPYHNDFWDFSIDYDNDLVELVSNRRFFYSNSTTSQPDFPDELREIAGYGNSPLVQYDGKGAYFLDLVQDGVWRLEVMPDAHWLDDLYSRTSPNKQIAAVHHTSRGMTIMIPDLGKDFRLTGINSGNTYRANAVNGSVNIVPGVYLLQQATDDAHIDPNQQLKNIRLNEYVAPSSDLHKTVVKNLTPDNFSAGAPAMLRFEVISAEMPHKITIMANGVFGWRQFEAVYRGADIYEVALPEETRVHGIMNYQLVLHWDDGRAMTFPANMEGEPWHWDFYDHAVWKANFLPDAAPLILWSAAGNWEQSMRSWVRGINLKPLHENKKAALFVALDQIPYSQDGTDSTFVYTFKYCFKHQIAGRSEELLKKNNLVIRAKSLNAKKPLLEISLVDVNGHVQGSKLELNNQDTEYIIPLSQLSEKRFAIIPRPYPEFKPYYASMTQTNMFDISRIETIQVSLIPNPAEKNMEQLYFYIEEITIE